MYRLSPTLYPVLPSQYWSPSSPPAHVTQPLSSVVFHRPKRITCIDACKGSPSDSSMRTCMQDGTETTRKLCLRNKEEPVPSSNYLSLLTLLLSASSVLTLAAPAAQLLFLHAVLSSVRLMFSSKNALVHFLMLSMYCILGRPLLLFPDIIPRMQVLQDYTYCFCMHVRRKPFFF